MKHQQRQQKQKPHHHPSSSEPAATSSSSSVATSSSSFSDLRPSSSSHHSDINNNNNKPHLRTSSSEPDPATSSSSSSSAGAEAVTVERRGEFSAVCRWSISGFAKLKARALWSKYFEVGGFDCRLLVYPKGDSQALPGYISVYLQIMDPRGTKWDCFASYRLSIVNAVDSSKTVHRDSWHRFSAKKKSHGWCDFTPSNSVSNDTVLITADILILNENVSFTHDCGSEAVGEVLSGKFVWKVNNFSLFKEMIKTQKIMSPVFPAGECNLRISVYQSSVNGVEYLSMCLESKDTEKTTLVSDRSCWCLFRMSVLNQKQGLGLNHMHRDSYGRFAADNKSGDNTSLGWNDYMKMSDFIGFLEDDTSVFSTSFHVIKELSSFSKNGGLVGVRGGNGGVKKSDGHVGRFTWRIENFTRLKDLLKKRKITGLCIKSRRFQIGNRDCRLIVYPRGQSQPPCHLSVFLEVTDSKNTSSDWSCFVSHRLSVVNQKMEEKSVTKESQNRYSKAAKDWGWREFVTLTSLFDQDSGFLVHDTVVFSAEVLILKETSAMQEFLESDTESSGSQVDKGGKRSSFTWKVENFLSFKEIMETRKIFSKFFQAGGCELRIGVYESFDTICIYLESDQSVGNDPDKNFWVKYRMAVVNQKNPAKTVWKESSICTKTWNNSVLQFMKVSDMLEADAGFLVRDTVVFVCEILDCCPWFDFSDLEVYASEDEEDALTTDPDELLDSEDSEEISVGEEDIFRNLLTRAGFHLTFGDNSSQPQVTLREKLLMDAGAIAGFLTGLRVYLDDPAKLKRLLLPTKFSSGSNEGKKIHKNEESSPSLLNLLMGVKVLQQAIIDLLLDIMVECCQPSEGSSNGDVSDAKVCPVESERENGAKSSDPLTVDSRLDSGLDERANTSAIQSSEMSGTRIPDRAMYYPPETSATGFSENASFRPKTKWPEKSEELLGLIVNSLRTLDTAVPQGYPEPKRMPDSAQKFAVVLDKAPMHLQPDLVSLVPKLVEHSEHPLAACALLDRLKRPDAEPALRVPVFGALSQLECSTDVWRQILFQSFELLSDANDEPLAATVDFIFKAALQCQHLPEAVRSVRDRLKDLGTEVSPSVLDYLSRMVSSCAEVAETLLREIDFDNDVDKSSSGLRSGLFTFGESGSNSERLCMVEDQTFRAGSYFSDIYILIDMLSIPCLAVEASQVFERAIARGTVLAQSVAMVLERRLARRLEFAAQFVAENFQHTDVRVEGEAIEHLQAQRDDFASVLGLAEALALSRQPQVRGFVKMLYAILFKWYADEAYRLRMLKGLVERATSTTDSGRELDLYLEILVILVCEEQEFVRPVLSMMREVAELANVDRAALWHQLCGSEDEIVRLCEEKEVELSNMVKEKATLSQRLSESETTNNRLKSEMKAEMDRFSRERKDLSEQIQDAESQIEWLRSERDDEITKLSAEKKAVQDRLHDAEAQLSQLKSRKRDELKRVMKEKTVLTERLKTAETARKRFDDELKRYATEKLSREEIRQSLEEEVRRLTQTVGETEGEKREKEEQVARCEAYIDGMEAKLQACQQYIHSLEASLQEEMSRHAPLYGAGLEALSMTELETLSRIHEDGLRQIHALQQRKGSSTGSPHNGPLSHGLYTAPPPQVAVGLPPSLIPNGVGIHNNGHINGAVGPWFNHSYN